LKKKNVKEKHAYKLIEKERRVESREKEKLGRKKREKV